MEKKKKILLRMIASELHGVEANVYVKYGVYKGIFICCLKCVKYVENSGCYTADERTKGMLRFQHF